MSVPIFMDISIKAQMQELHSYFISLGADLPKESKEDEIEELKELITACDIVFKGQRDLSDAECVLNSFATILPGADASKVESLVKCFSEKMAQNTNPKIGVVCLNVLQNLYDGLGDASPLTYDVYYNMIKIAGLTDSIAHIYNDLTKLKKWFQTNQFSAEQVQRLLRFLHEVLLENKQSEQASKVMVELLGTYTEDNASQARDDAHRCIVTCLGDPNTFLMDHLVILKPVKFLEGEHIHDLLTIFVSEKLDAYLQFYQGNKDFVHSLGLSHEQNLQKMRLLTLMQMAESRKEIHYHEIEKELLLEIDDIEGFIIDALRTKMVKAKLDQLQKKVVINSTVHRTFGRPQWLHIRNTLMAWRSNLANVEVNMQTIIGADVANLTIRS